MYIDKCSLVDLSRFANSVLAGRLFVRPTTVNHVVVVFSMKCIGFVWIANRESGIGEFVWRSQVHTCTDSERIVMLFVRKFCNAMGCNSISALRNWFALSIISLFIAFCIFTPFGIFGNHILFTIFCFLNFVSQEKSALFYI